jgi:DNA-binding MarR family transcriptional regulator
LTSTNVYAGLRLIMEYMETRFQRVKIVIFYGAQNGSSKLTAKQVRRIRDLYAAGDETCRSLGEKFGVSPQTVHNIVERVTWQRVAG